VASSYEGKKVQSPTDSIVEVGIFYSKTLKVNDALFMPVVKYKCAARTRIRKMILRYRSPQAHPTLPQKNLMLTMSHFFGKIQTDLLYSRSNTQVTTILHLID